MKTFETGDGVAIAYEEAGNRGDGAPLVLLHGWTGFAADFGDHPEALARGRRVLVPDLRGHGASARFRTEADVTFAALVEDLVSFLSGVAREPVHLLGHSMGGMIALRAALDPRVELASLILMDTTAAPLEGIDLASAALGGRIAREQGMATLARRLRELESGSQDRAPAARAHERAWGERYWAWRAARIEAMDPLAYEAFVRAMAEQEGVVGRLGEIRVPTLVMVGSQDRGFLQPSAVMARDIPDARLALIVGAAHQPQFEAPARWREVLQEHLDRVEALGAAAR